jgi:CRP-like cAMP-binding protein
MGCDGSQLPVRLRRNNRRSIDARPTAGIGRKRPVRFRVEDTKSGRRDGSSNSAARRPRATSHSRSWWVRRVSVALTTEHSCKLPLTQAALGDALGLSTVHVNRSIMELRRLGLITLEKQLLTIPDWERLEQYAGFDPTYLHLVQSCC